MPYSQKHLGFAGREWDAGQRDDGGGADCFQVMEAVHWPTNTGRDIETMDDIRIMYDGKTGSLRQQMGTAVGRLSLLDVHRR